jgi:hypothetical protein
MEEVRLSLREAANNLKLTLRPRERVFQPAANECEGARQEGKLGKIEIDVLSN